MRFFKACVNEQQGEMVYFKAETWYKARDLARRLYPFEVLEASWSKMEALEEAPAWTAGLQAYEFDGNREPRKVPEYDLDARVPAKNGRKQRKGTR